MSDGSSIGGAFKDLARETVKQVSKTPASFIKSAGAQIVGSPSEEDENRKKAEKAMTHQRIKEIEAEMAKIRNQGEQKHSQEENSDYKKKLETIASRGGNKNKQMDESSRQAVGRAEQGRNFKG